MNGIAIYIHIPFCIKKCAYCDFLSFPDFSCTARYKDRLISEIKAFRTEKQVRSVFIGGGTPSAVDSDIIVGVMECLKKQFNFADDCEITIEANPGTLTDEKLSAYKASGINRLSMGVQSCDDRLLEILGRIHNNSDFLDSYSLAQRYFDNINLDLMFALPEQSLNTWENTLKQAVLLNPSHISAYSLIIEENTPFYKQYTPVDDEIDRQMYYAAVQFLAENGYRQYEISNFAKEGLQCKHNLRYWQGGDYKGFGLGAASLIDNCRLKNTEKFDLYLNGVTVDEEISLSLNEQMQEFVLLGLRCTDGIDAQVFNKRFNADLFSHFGGIFEKHSKNGLLKIDGNRIKLTKKGIDLSNIVFVDFVD